MRVDVIVLNFNDSVSFVRYMWAPQDQINVHLNIYINRRGYAVHCSRRLASLAISIF